MSTVTPDSLKATIREGAKKAFLAVFQGDVKQVEQQWTGLFELRQKYAPLITEEKTYQWRFRNSPNNSYHEWENTLMLLNYYGGMGFQKELMELFETIQAPLCKVGQKRQPRLVKALQNVPNVQVASGKNGLFRVSGKQFVLYLHPDFIFDFGSLKFIYKTTTMSLADLQEVAKTSKNTQVQQLLSLYAHSCDLRKGMEGVK